MLYLDRDLLMIELNRTVGIGFLFVAVLKLVDCEGYEQDTEVTI